MAVTPVAWVEQLGDAVVTHGDVGRNRCLGTGNHSTGHDPELAPVGGVCRQVRHADRGDAGQRRGLRTQPATELCHPRAFALHLEKDRAGIIADEPGQAELAGDPVDERTEANPLNNTGHGEALPDLGTGDVGPQQQGGIGHLTRPPG